MADLLIEAYEVCYGTGLDDPAPQIVSLPYRTKAGAMSAAAALNQAARAGGFDPASTDPAKAFFLRPRGGQQKLAVATEIAGDPPTAHELLTALADADVMVPIWVRHLNPAGSVQVGVLTRDQLLAASI